MFSIYQKTSITAVAEPQSRAKYTSGGEQKEQRPKLTVVGGTEWHNSNTGQVFGQQHHSGPDGHVGNGMEMSSAGLPDDGR